ncbi:uncharacterized protein LOC107424178 isoform X2 [Ziziphus jujuba]|uniref:Uncharacterized protein LOC107424178 isoform X2 n=1 Tax=Ziziphus jujuba TaxID=326968 RepID=A0ABM4AEB5_ZIZJJ|nr:uncharacterized protein LOC107424178 isoform X2 [Ziziphus jujuba]
MIQTGKLLWLGLVSMLTFLTKYPRLKIHHSKSTTEEQSNRSGKVNDLLGVGSFSVLALVISCARERQQGSAGFGVFDFILQLTMDASMEIPAGHGNGSGPNLWYMFGAYVYCFLLLIIRNYGNSLAEHGISSSVARQETLLQDQDQPLEMDSVTIDIDRQLRVPFRHHYSNHYSHSNSIGNSTTTSSSGILDWSRGSVFSSNSDTVDGRSDHESIVEVVPEREEEEKRGDVILDGESNINVQLNECGSYDVEGENKNKEGTSDGESKDVETNECGNYETKGEDEDTEVMLDGDTKDMQWGNYKVDGLRRRKNMTRSKAIWSDEVEIADMKILKPYSYGWEWRLPSFTDSLVSVTLTNNVFESFTKVLSLFGCSLFSNNDDPKHQNGHEISTPLYLDTRQIHFYRYSAKNNQKWPWICWCWGYNRYVDGVELKIFLEGGEFGERHQREDQKDGDDYSHYERKKVVFPLPRKGQLLGGRQRKPMTK